MCGDMALHVKVEKDQMSPLRFSTSNTTVVWWIGKYPM